MILSIIEISLNFIAILVLALLSQRADRLESDRLQAQAQLEEERRKNQELLALLQEKGIDI